MKKIVKFIPLLLTPLMLSSCGVVSNALNNIASNLNNVIGINNNNENNSSENNSSSENQSSSGENSSQGSQSSSSSTTVQDATITISKANASLKVGETVALTASVSDGSSITWLSSNTSVATVSKGVVTAVSEGTATITASATTNGRKISKTCVVTVTASSTVGDKAKWTVMVYMCGADLESDSGLATSDLNEILKVSGQPDDVNIIVETGGAKSWKSGQSYTISSSKLERWHVDNKKLVKDDSLTYASMGLSSTFQSFLEWGLTEYPAEKTGVIMWNHGGGMQGVCFDEKKSDDSLLTNEVVTAVKNAKENTGHTEKLEWIGYDACLMQVQDIAEKNSPYFNYMIASEESESGYGWDYDTWVDDLYAKKSTQTILKAIVDGFITENGGTSSSKNDQTLSYLNLDYADEYLAAWEDMAANITITSSNKSSFNSLVKSVKYYADNYMSYYGLFDAKDFVNKLANNSTFNPGSTYTDAVLEAHANFVEYSSCGKGAGNSYGLAMFWSVSSSCGKSSYYTSSMTNFANWRSLNTSYGY